MPVSAAPTPAARVRPFLKWAGGKRQLLREIARFVPRDFRAYHEPFLGSGAVFFDLWRRNLLVGRPCRLADANPDLVGCYQAIAADVDAVVRHLTRLADRHRADPPGEYYRVRDRLFNPRRRAAAFDPTASYPPDLAAMLVYLNRTGYNGLFRLNSRGDFNVPIGRYANPTICDEGTLRAVSAVLREPRVTIGHGLFPAVLDAAASGDFVYFDPPYAPLSATARFTAYTSTTFSDDSQRELHAIVLELIRRGCAVVLSNSTAPIVTALYDSPAARAAGLRAHRVAATRAINSNSARRGEVEEYIITNVDG